MILLYPTTVNIAWRVALSTRQHDA